MEASLTCAVCLGVFREPVTLPTCSHNFCKSCLVKCAGPHLWSPAQPHSTTASCPLCRKVSTLSNGLAALPINHTLAEVVRLLLPSGGATEAGPGSPDCSGKRRCEEHPEYRLELFCRNCEQVCCGRCVSLRHQGVFHSVNLLDVTFQEEKLVFFNSLKTLREMNEKFVKELSDPKNTESILKANEDAVTSAFGEAQKALDLKKQEFLDVLKSQQSASKKRNEIRKVTKTLHKATVESLLKDCVKIVDEYEPSRFLQAACGLNKRIKSNLELQKFCVDHNEDLLQIEPQCLDIQAVLDAVSTLKMTSGSKDVSKQNGSFSFKSISRTWSHGMETNEKYCDEELIYLPAQMENNPIRFVCITKMPEYQHLSYEELHLKYYELSVVQDRKTVCAPEMQMPRVCNNVNGFIFKMSLTNCAKSTRLKRQDYFDREHTVWGKNVFEEKTTKLDIGLWKKKDNLSACALDNDYSEDMCVNYAFSEEFYDASCNLDSDVEEPCAQSNSHQLQRR